MASSTRKTTMKIPTIKQYTSNYERWTAELRKNAERIENSSDCRVFLTKNAASAPWSELLKAAVVCIYDLTGDSQFRDQVLSEIERRTE